MLSSHLLQQLRPLIAGLTSAQRLELVRWIAEAPAVEPTPDAWAARISGEAAAWYTRAANEREAYAGHYVAVLSGQVIDHDPDQRALAIRIHRQYPTTPVLIIAAEAREPREYLILSPRFEKDRRGAQCAQ